MRKRSIPTPWGSQLRPSEFATVKNNVFPNAYKAPFLGGGGVEKKEKKETVERQQRK